MTVPIASNDAAKQSWLHCLPAYSRSLLKIEVPVTVTLATAKLPIGNIRALVPGTILQFEKMCDETLSLEVGGQPVAEGETVKVGDKFGLRLTSMVMPVERFVRVESSRQDVAEESNAGEETPPAAS